MKQITVFVLLLLLLLPQSVCAQQTVPPAADNHLETFDAAIVTLQSQNYSAGGRYLQYLRRQSTDTGPRCPGDQAACPEIPGAPDTPKFDYVVNVYRTTSGDGFESVGYYYDNDGNVYRRSINHGPETWRSHDWIIVESEEVEN